MRVSQKLDYAMKTLVLLASKPTGSFVSAGELANRLGLPRRFVEQQISALGRAGIVVCKRGPAGGCSLERDAADISALDVTNALQGYVVDVPRQAGNAVVGLWEGMAANLEEYLATVSLADLAAEQKRLDAQAAPMYYI